ncbi:EAL domain-containing protein [Alkalimonas sp.]|uniref:EAL domain-containing response regulator n=1 Tax=Alkalimonas sp. TaxID=1872453 RepID=UPI00263ABB58|nr:EAL domain-containing protein [Alkalimonas sp.]MCC5827733.1 EAL domain-containing protein [Alkalimonas sp.]
MQQAILLVDDEHSVLKALKRLFCRHGYHVVTANSGREAIEQLTSGAFPVIITDFRMPEMSGAELLRVVSDRWPQTINLVLSGYTDFKSVVELLNEGLAFRFLEKPWDETDILQHVKDAFDAFHQQQQKNERDQLLLGSHSALIELNKNGILQRANAAALVLLPELATTEQPLHRLVNSSEPEVFLRFCQGELDELLVWDQQQKPVLLERYLSDDFGHIVQLSHEVSVVDEPHFPPQVQLASEQALAAALHDCLEMHRCCSLIVLGISQYDALNDLLGFRTADQLIVSITEALVQSLNTTEKLCYLNGDRFLLLLSDVDSEQGVLQRLEQICQAFQAAMSQQYKMKQIKLFGVYGMAPDDGLTLKELLSPMRLCMTHQAKSARQSFCRFDEQLVKDYRRNFEISRALLQPELEQQLQLKFQPKMNRDGKIVGAEALLRWFEPQKHGWVSPAVFVPIAEREGQILDIGRWVLAKACQQLAEWQQAGCSPLSIAVNLSGRQLKEDVGLVPFIAELLAQYQVAPSCLGFELTETYLVQDLQHCQQQMLRLRELGCTLYIDDFGCGYSSLSYLSRLPADAIKLDKSLIDELESSLAVQSMVRNIIRMSHDLKLLVVAEGIETSFQLGLLKDMGCDLFQGFLLAQPLAPKDFSQLAFQGEAEG